MKKRVFALALALMLTLSLLPMAALAADDDAAIEPVAEPVEETEPETDVVAAVQALIDALPDADTITAENRADVEAQLTAIDDARLELDDDSTLDYTRYQAAIAALNGLDDMAGAEVPVTLEGETGHTNHCVCGATHSSVGDHKDKTVIETWTAVSGQDGIGSTGNYYLTNDVTLTNKWTIQKDSNIVLCLNGHKLTADNANVADTILIEGTLTITDCAGTGKITGTNTEDTKNNKVLVVSAVYANCTLNLYGGTITGINVGTGNGGGVHNEGTFNMYGGSITDNKAAEGGGVCTFKNNTSSSYKGDGEFNFYGGTISNNETTNGHGGGVYVCSSSTFNMYGGSITGNKVLCGGKAGGGVFIDGGTFTMSGGNIADNSASQTAGNDVHNWTDGTMNANGGNIAGNVYNQHGTITTTTTTGTTTFNGAVMNGDETYSGTISGGTYNAAVTNNGKGTISGGTYNAAVTGNGTIDASAKVTVTFDPSGGNTVDSQEVLKGQKAMVPNVSRGGFDFAGWYEKDDTGAFKDTAFDFVNTAITANVKLYAKWACAVHTGGTATCTKKAVCDTCNEEYGEVNAANHTALKHVETKAATLETEGNTEYWHCENCGKYYSDKDCKNEIALADTVVAKLTPTATPTAKPAQSPKTGDEANLALWLALLAVSVLGVAVVARKKVK